MKKIFFLCLCSLFIASCNTDTSENVDTSDKTVIVQEENSTEVVTELEPEEIELIENLLNEE